MKILNAEDASILAVLAMVVSYKRAGTKKYLDKLQGAFAKGVGRVLIGAIVGSKKERECAAGILKWVDGIYEDYD